MKAQNDLPPNLQRAMQAAIALDLAPERHVRNAARAALYEVGERGRDSVKGHGPDPWLCVLREHLPRKPRLRLVPGLTAALAPFPRVWCPELSVLDADVDGERWVWHVPAKPANDTEKP